MRLEESLQDAMENKLTQAKHRMYLYVERMKGLSPLDKLKQGYSYVSTAENKTLTSVRQVGIGDRLCIYVTDGVIEAETRAKRLAEIESQTD